MKIDKFGCWQGIDCDNRHAHDSKLCQGLIDFFKKKKCSSLIDVGCGEGDYVEKFLKNNINAIGFDGNSETKKASGNKCGVFNFCSDAKSLGVYDWVLSLEVGEHLPKQYEEMFILNLHQLNKRGIVLSWAIEGQRGFGHFNCRNNDYIKSKFDSMGYKNIVKDEESLRNLSSKFWFKDTIMVFERI